jgi:hypothetical protein
MSADVERVALTSADIGKLYRVPWSPNPHRLEELRPRHCQMHGEYLWVEAVFRKRRNSEIRPWGSLYSVKADNPGIADWLTARAKEVQDGTA